MIYTKTCEYAIRALSYFSGQSRGASVSVKEISRHAGVPGPYVGKIFQCLVQKGILESRRGKRGGYSLKMHPSKLALIQVIRALDDIEKSPFSNCIMGLHQCNDDVPCPLHLTWMTAKERMLKQLSRHTIADVAPLVDQFESGRCDRSTLSKSMRGVFACFLAAVCFLAAAPVCQANSTASEGEKPAFAGKYPAFGLAKEEGVLKQGAKVYQTYCIGCHGEKGDGNGPAARFLSPRPRNFQAAQFRFSSRASGDLPTDEDLLRTVTEGLHGTSMPAWPLLPEEDRKAVVAYIKTFAKDAWANASPSVPTAISDDPYYGQDKAEAIKLGEQAYHGMAQCYSCHPVYVNIASLNEASAKYGISEVTELRQNAYESRAIQNEDGTMITPPDFTWNKLKRGTDERTLYHVVANGISGTPMPTWKGVLSEEDIWAIVYYVQSLARQRPHRVTDADLSARRERVLRMESENRQIAEKITRAAAEKARQEAEAQEKAKQQAAAQTAPPAA